MMREIKVIISCSICDDDHYVVRTATMLSDSELRHPAGKEALRVQAQKQHVASKHVDSVIDGLTALLHEAERRRKP